MKKVVSLLLTLIMTMGVLCAIAESPKTELNYASYKVGTATTAIWEQACLERFRETYGDTIDLYVEELPSDTAYTDKMKVLAAANELPDLIEGKNGLRDLAVANGQCIDLKPFLDDDPEFADFLGERTIAANTDKDGKVLSIAGSASIAGYYYNKEIFEACGIKPAETWDEFFENCRILDENGYTAVGLMTGENSWTTNLLLACMIGSSSDEGYEFINTYHPETYQLDCVIDALDKIKELFQYANSDALGAVYASVQNQFCNEEIAMMFNGSWMITDFTNPELSADGFYDKIGVAAYPGNTMIAYYGEGYSICATDPQKQDAAWKLLKTLCDEDAQRMGLELCNYNPSGSLELSEEFKAENTLLAELISLYNNADRLCGTFDVNSYATVVDTFGQYYPELVAGSISAAEMAEMLDLAASEAAAAAAE